MNVATSTIGVRDLRDALSAQLGRVRTGESLTVTSHGKPVARLVPYETESVLEGLIAQRIARPPSRHRGAAPEAVPAEGSVAELVADQRR